MGWQADPPLPDLNRPKPCALPETCPSGEDKDPQPGNDQGRSAPRHHSGKTPPNPATPQGPAPANRLTGEACRLGIGPSRNLWRWGSVEPRTSRERAEPRTADRALAPGNLPTSESAKPDTYWPQLADPGNPPDPGPCHPRPLPSKDRAELAPG